MNITRALLLLAVTGPTGLEAQVQIRLEDSARATYSELHEGLRKGTPAADSVLRILEIRSPAPLWRKLRRAIAGKEDWNSALIAMTRLAGLRSSAYADSARRMLGYLSTAEWPPFPGNPGLKAEDLEPSLQAVILEHRRRLKGDSVVLREILDRIPTRKYNHGDAWVLGRLGSGALDSISSRFQSDDTDEFKVRYLTLLSYFTDPRLIPLLTRVYAAPDSFGVPKRYAIRASDGLLWIGTKEAMAALLDARAHAKARAIYADSTLARGGYDFLANDSSAVISRTGRWLTEWVTRLPRALQGGTPRSGPATTGRRKHLTGHVEHH